MSSVLASLSEPAPSDQTIADTWAPDDDDDDDDVDIRRSPP